MNDLDLVDAPARPAAQTSLNFSPVEGSPPQADSGQASAGVFSLQSITSGKNGNHDSGIYCIKNNITGRFYIGSATDFSKRWADHRCKLRAGKHHNQMLQRSYFKHGESAFFVFVIEHIAGNRKEIRLAERKWIDKTCAISIGYNMTDQTDSGCDCPMLGEKLTRKAWSRFGDLDAFLDSCIKKLDCGETLVNVASFFGVNKRALSGLLKRFRNYKVKRTGNKEQQIKKTWESRGVDFASVCKIVESMADVFPVFMIAKKLETQPKAINRLIRFLGCKKLDFSTIKKASALICSDRKLKKAWGKIGKDYCFAKKTVASMLLDGASQREIINELGCTRSMLSGLLRRESLGYYAKTRRPLSETAGVIA